MCNAHDRKTNEPNQHRTNKMKTRILTITLASIFAITLLPARADDQALQRRLEVTRGQVRGLLKSPESCKVMCEEMMKDKKAKKMMCETMMKDPDAMKTMGTK